MKKLFILIFIYAGVLANISMASAQGFIQPTLTGENLYGLTQDHTQNNCVIGQPYSVNYNIKNGYASGNYTGTFNESGNFTIVPQSGGTATVTSFNASFEIVSTVGHITGTKTSDNASFIQTNCAYYDGLVNASFSARYNATITNNGYKFFDHGTSQATYYYGGQKLNPASVGETFTSSLEKLETISPTNKNECKDSGYQNFVNPDTLQPLKNQGECIKFVNNYN